MQFPASLQAPQRISNHHGVFSEVHSELEWNVKCAAALAGDPTTGGLSSFGAVEPNKGFDYCRSTRHTPSELSIHSCKKRVWSRAMPDRPCRASTQ